MKVLIKIKDNLKLDDLQNRFFSHHRHKAQNDNLICDRRVFIKDNIGILFLRDRIDLPEIGHLYFEDSIVDFWKNIFEEIVKKFQFPEEVLTELLIKSTGVNIEEFESWQDPEEDNKFSFYRDYEDLVYRLFLDIGKETEYEYIINQECFYLVNKNNAFIILNGKMYLSIDELYYVEKDGELIISDEKETLLEYLVPIFQIDAGMHSFDCTLTSKEIRDYLSANSKLIYEPIVKNHIKKTTFESASVPKINYDVSFEDFINALEFTNYSNMVITYKIWNEFQDDSCSEFDFKSRFKEDDNTYVGLAHSIRYIKENDIRYKEQILDGSLKFSYIKRVNTLVIESLPKVNGIFVLNEAILKVILKMLYNVTDLENIKDIFISNKIIGNVVISNSVLKRFPKLSETYQYKKALECEEILRNAYSDEVKVRRAVDIRNKKERRNMIIAVNQNKERIDEAMAIMENGGTNFIRGVRAIKDESANSYLIYYHESKTKEYSKKSYSRIIHIIKAPEVIDLKKVDLDLKGFVISFPEGTREIKNFSIDGNTNLEKIYNLARQGTLSRERCLFIVLPSSLDLNKFKFFKVLDHRHLVFISDDIHFIEQFRSLRKQYNMTCEHGEHFNAPIVYDGDIYEKMWGYRSSSFSLFRDLESRIISDQGRILRERKEIEKYRFFEKKELAYIPDEINVRIIEKFLSGLTDEEIKRYIGDGNNLYSIFDCHSDNLFEHYGDNIVRVETDLYFKRGIIRERIKKLLLQDPEIVMAINENNLSKISPKYLRKVLKECDSFFRIYDNLKPNRFLKYVYKILEELVEEKIYYDLPSNDANQTVELDYDPYVDSISKKDFYLIAKNILSNEILVEILNHGINSLNYDVFLAELKSYSSSSSAFDVYSSSKLTQYLYVFDVLRKSRIYFEGGELPEKLIKSLAKDFSGGVCNYKGLVLEYEEYINSLQKSFTK